MKVLMLGWELPPHHAGGMGIVCYQMCKGLSASGVAIEFILPYTAAFDIDFMTITHAHEQSVEEVKFAGGVYDTKYFSQHRVSVGSEHLDLRQQHDLYAHNVARLVEFKEFDIIHAHDWLTFKAGVLAKRATGKPLIAHVHATQFDQSAGNKGNPEVREIEYMGLMEADQIFAVSQHTKNVIVREYGIPADKIHVVHNSMEVTETSVDDTDNLHAYLKVMKNQGYKIVVNAGRKTIQKGLTHLLDAAALVVEKDPKVLFVLAGGGEQENELVELAAHYHISRNVIFIGWMNGTGKPWRDTFRIADIFIMPSVSEPFGIAALEAIGYGAPVIVSKQSGVGEVLQNCFKVDFWDKAQMADMILSLANNTSLARTMWENSYSEYANMSWDKSVSVMKHRYHHAAGIA